MQPAYLYEKLPRGTVKCTACAHYCHIQSERTGVCGVRKNINGELFLLVYGKAIAVNIDPIEKKPLFHFLPKSEIFSLGTLGCNFACEFCQNWDISQFTKNKNNAVNLDQLGQSWPPQAIVNYCQKHQIPAIAYTYNEPTIFIEYAYDTARSAREQGIKNVFVSNGYGSAEAYQFISQYLDAINVDLKSFNPQYYQKTCHANIKPVLENIQRLHDLGIWLEITTLLVPGQNDSEDELQKIAEFLVNIDSNIPWHISRFFPQYKMSDLPPTPIETLEKAYHLAKQTGLKYVYTGNLIDTNLESTYCPQCGKIVVERSGYAIGEMNIKNGKCKHCDAEIKGVWKLEIK